jgi:alpha-beta hydrolase superfamily lysophospholipase
MTAPDGRAFYLTAGDEPFLCHVDAPGGAPRAAVLLVPPFGWEEVSSYRPRRTWARHLAATHGATVLRAELPGAGDSAGEPGDPDRLPAWVAAVHASARWLAAAVPPPAPVTAVGLGLGGMLAWLAAVEGAPVGDLVLWGTPGRGRTLLRELKAFARLERSRLQELNPGREVPADPEGELWAAGFRLTAETQQALGAVDLARAPLPDAAGRRILLLGRDGVGPDKALVDAAGAGGAEVTTGPGEGWGALMTQPQFSHLAPAALPPADAFLAAAPDRPRAPADPPAAAAEALVAGGVRERPLRVAGLEAIVSEPETGAGGADLPALLLLNAGSVRRIGPNRMWVEIARRWAARGLTVLRADLPGIGESDGDDDYTQDVRYYEPPLDETVRALVDALHAAAAGAPIAAIGLCSGAYWSMRATLDDDRVAAGIVLNPRVLVWDPEQLTARDARKLRLLTRASTYRRVLRGDIPVSRGAEIARALLRRTTSRPRGGTTPAGDGPVAAAFDALERAGSRLTMVFTGNEPVLDELRASGQLDDGDRWPGRRITLLDELGDVHTLAPPHLQRTVHDLVDEAIAHEVDRAVASGSGRR